MFQELQSINGLLTATKQTVSIVELGRRLRKCARLGNTEQVHELMTKGAPFTTDWVYLKNNKNAVLDVCYHLMFCAF